MKAAFIQEHGGADKIRFGEVPDPILSDGNVLLKVRACALNYLDVRVRRGSPAYPVPMPHILGSDISGEILSFSPKIDPRKVCNLSIGSPVVVFPGIFCGDCPECLSGHDNQCVQSQIIGAKIPGGYAERISVPFRNIFPKPEHLTFEEAAAFPLVFVTAWHMLVSRAGLRPGETVLILGAGSGVGSAAIQIVKACGGIAIAISSSHDKLQTAKKLGADYGIHGGKEDFSLKVKEITQGRGVDIVFEHVGPATWEQSFKSLAKRGRIVTCGDTSGPEVRLELRSIFSRDISIYGSKLGTISEFLPILKLFEQKRFTPVVSQVFPLKEAREAHEHLENQRQCGKVVLKI